MSTVCIYVTMLGQAFGWTQILPTMIAMTLKVVSMLTHQMIFILFGFYLYAGQLVLWGVQSYMQVVMPDPTCQAYHTFSTPSIPGYYIASIVTFVIGYSLLWDVKQSWFMWLTFYVVFTVPPSILVLNSYNAWYEVVASLVIGIVMTMLFIGLIYVYIKPIMCFILNIFPCNWLGYKDSWLSSPEEQEQCRQIRLDIDAVDLYLKHGQRLPYSR